MLKIVIPIILGLSLISPIYAKTAPLQSFIARYQIMVQSFPVGQATRQVKAAGKNHYTLATRVQLPSGISPSYLHIDDWLYRHKKWHLHRFVQQKIMGNSTQTTIAKSDGHGGLNVAGKLGKRHFKGSPRHPILSINRMGLALQHDARDGKQQMSYRFFEHHHVVAVTFKKHTTGKLELPMGNYTAISYRMNGIKNQSLMVWLAPKLNWQIVRIALIRHGHILGEARLSQLNTNMRRP